MTQPGEDLHEDEALDAALDAAGRDPEAPDADALERAIPASPYEQRTTERSLGLEVNEADALEQEKIVEFDEDYRN